MVTANAKPGLGMGLYTPQEAAAFAKLRTETFNRWFYGDGHGRPALRPRLVGDGERIVTFWDLMQAVAVRTMRNSAKGSRIKLQHIRDVVDECAARGIQFPLAQKHTLYWFSDRLILKTSGGDYIGLVKGVDRDQLYKGQIIEPFLREVKYDSSGMVDVWTPLSLGKFRVDLNAGRRYGLPAIEPGGILTSALVDAVESEGSIEAAADAFETKPDAAILALKYQEYLRSAA